MLVIIRLGCQTLRILPKIQLNLVKNIWKNFLIDADFDGSSSLSVGFAQIAPGGNLTLHYHSPAEIYVVTSGTGILNKSGELETIKKSDVVYIAGNAEHSLKNNGKETLEFYWIFPTDRFSEVEYFSTKKESE